MVRSFKKWLIQEKTDIFGFDKDKEWAPKQPRDENPLKRFGLHRMMKYLSTHNVGLWEGKLKYANEVHWGTGNGSMRIWVGTGLNVMIERQGIDLEGTPRWFCKKVFQIDQRGYGGFEEGVANELIDHAETVFQMELDSPKKEYEDLEKLVSRMASKIKRTARDIFVFEGITKVENNHFIIKFGIRGHGVEAPGQQRVEQNQTTIYFSPESGVIRMTNTNIESPVGGHKWEIMPSDTDWYFAPTQPEDEIIETIANTFHWY